MSLKITNPYASGTFNSKLFRIPAILTLKNGRILACADVRYGNGTDDPANIDVGARYSDDNGVTWSEGKFVNEFCDMEYEDHNKAIATSASFIDSAIAQGEDGTVYHMCDACPAYMGLWSAGTYGKENGFIDGKLAVCDKTSADKAESTKLNKEKYPYFVDDFSADGFAPVRKFSDNEIYDNYFVDRDYKIYKKSEEEYTPVLIKQMNKDGSLSDKDIVANLFYAYSPIKIYPTYYLWVKKSSDNGETWGDGRIINLEIKSKGFTGFAPGRGISIDYNGKNRIIFAVYDNNDGREYTSVIYTDDGENWHRSQKARGVGEAGKGSETQFVLLNNGVLRMYSRNTAGFIGYSDSTDGGENWSDYKLDKDLSYCANCQFSVINYSKEIDGKKVIIISYPSEKIRKLGVIKVGFVNNDNTVEWRYRKNVTDSVRPYTFVYSCLTELNDGTIVDLYESYKAEISCVRYSLDDLKVNDNGISGFVKFKSFIHNKLKR
ncbi:MAG: exo-alpha-sialidase [Clostridia bacterium]|nr:exo-alpha-sialidase [Clostridia bacterium]